MTDYMDLFAGAEAAAITSPDEYDSNWRYQRFAKPFAEMAETAGNRQKWRVRKLAQRWGITPGEYWRARYCAIWDGKNPTPETIDRLPNPKPSNSLIRWWAAILRKRAPMKPRDEKIWRDVPYRQCTVLLNGRKIHVVAESWFVGLQFEDTSSIIIDRRGICKFYPAHSNPTLADIVRYYTRH